jgi:hypothetical protein
LAAARQARPTNQRVRRPSHPCRPHPPAPCAWPCAPTRRGAAPPRRALIPFSALIRQPARPPPIPCPIEKPPSGRQSLVLKPPRARGPTARTAMVPLRQPPPAPDFPTPHDQPHNGAGRGRAGAGLLLRLLPAPRRPPARRPAPPSRGETAACGARGRAAAATGARRRAPPRLDCCAACELVPTSSAPAGTLPPSEHTISPPMWGAGRGPAARPTCRARGGELRDLSLPCRLALRGAARPAPWGPLHRARARTWPQLEAARGRRGGSPPHPGGAPAAARAAAPARGARAPAAGAAWRPCACAHAPPAGAARPRLPNKPPYLGRGARARAPRCTRAHARRMPPRGRAAPRCAAQIGAPLLRRCNQFTWRRSTPGSIAPPCTRAWGQGCRGGGSRRCALVPALAGPSPQAPPQGRGRGRGGGGAVRGPARGRRDRRRVARRRRRRGPAKPQPVVVRAKLDARGENRPHGWRKSGRPGAPPAAAPRGGIAHWRARCGQGRKKPCGRAPAPLRAPP